MRAILAGFTNLFPVWVAAGGIAALFEPKLFTWFDNGMIVWGLALVMLGMGITLTLDDFRNVLRMPRAVATGFLAHYTIMPLLGVGIAWGLHLPTQFAVGLILVSCCPSGTASNVVNYLGHNNVALAVLVTLVSTLGAIFMTPLLTGWLAGKLVPVDAYGLFLSTLKVVLAPLILGLLLNRYAPRVVAKISVVSPLVSVVVIALICASIIGQNAQAVVESGGRLLLSVFLLHSGGFLIGYFFARLIGYDRIISRTLSIEVGMQNSGLGVVLAKQHFADPITGIALAAVPCAISSVFHSVIGSALAGYWRWRQSQVYSALSTER